VIIGGGHSLDRAAIEEAFLAHPEVEPPAAVGLPDAYAGELPMVLVTRRPGSAIGADSLLAAVAPRIRLRREPQGGRARRAARLRRVLADHAARRECVEGDGHEALAEDAAQGPWLRRDLARCLRRHGLALGRDLDALPADPVPPGRVFHLLDAQSPDAAKRARSRAGCSARPSFWGRTSRSSRWRRWRFRRSGWRPAAGDAALP
jgi:hypothetical protein